jgi:hypothetical protein
MKKIIFLLVITACFSSCKKTYTCNCVTTFTYPGTSYPDDTYSSTPDISYTQNMSKRKATAACEHEGKNINQTYTNMRTGNGQTNSSAGISTKCSLK